LRLNRNDVFASHKFPLHSTFLPPAPPTAALASACQQEDDNKKHKLSDRMLLLRNTNNNTTDVFLGFSPLAERVTSSHEVLLWHTRYVPGGYFAGSVSFPKTTDNSLFAVRELEHNKYFPLFRTGALTCHAARSTRRCFQVLYHHH